MPQFRLFALHDPRAHTAFGKQALSGHCVTRLWAKASLRLPSLPATLNRDAPPI